MTKRPSQQTLEDARTERCRQISSRIDFEMEAARQTFSALDGREDPYAMQKAVESLSIEVMIEVIRSKTIRQITTHH